MLMANMNESMRTARQATYALCRVQGGVACQKAGSMLLVRRAAEWGETAPDAALQVNDFLMLRGPCAARLCQPRHSSAV